MLRATIDLAVLGLVGVAGVALVGWAVFSRLGIGDLVDAEDRLFISRGAST